ncbi:MAG: hypothetical protein ACLQDC_06725, partial [Verrucomicrobiia bacterium]
MGSFKGCLSKSARIVLFVSLVGALSFSVQAQVINLTNGGSLNFAYVTNSTVSVLIADKLFGNFGFRYTDTTGSTNDYLTASDLELSALANQ